MERYWGASCNEDCDECRKRKKCGLSEDFDNEEF